MTDRYGVIKGEWRWWVTERGRPVFDCMTEAGARWCADTLNRKEVRS
ncbi:hypothetical protein [Paludifilum halophilum]|nr:hypothetical protein [Paludifilum halophilum]